MEHYQIELENQQRRALELVGELDRINREIASLRIQKESMELELIEVIGHEHEGSKTYAIGDMSVTIKTEKIYALDKKTYISGDVYLPPEFDPVLQKITYDVNKTLFKAYRNTAPESVRQILDTLITIKDGKPSIGLKVRV